TGNTVVDALLQTVDSIKNNDSLRRELDTRIHFLDRTKRLVVVTGHRRESFGPGFESICRALRRLATENDDVEIVYPVHLNPNVQQPVRAILGGVARVHLIEPVDYLPFVELMRRSTIIITDSG